jgi:MFS family permease
LSAAPFHRNRFTWAAYGALLAFGFLNAVLGPILPFLRAVEGISYLVGALHQLAYAMGGAAAGLLAHRDLLGRSATIRFGLAGAALAGLGLGFGDAAAITLPATLAMGFLNTAALIALWAALSDAHRGHRAVAMTEGEVAVSLGGIVVPLLVAVLASTALTWRFAMVIGAALVGVAVLWIGAVRVPEQERFSTQPAIQSPDDRSERWSPLLAVIFSIVALEFGLSFWLASYLNVSVGLERGLAVALVAALYGANLAGRLLASRLARQIAADRLLAFALLTAMVGLPILIASHATGPATLGFVITGMASAPSSRSPPRSTSAAAPAPPTPPSARSSSSPPSARPSAPSRSPRSPRSRASAPASSSSRPWSSRRRSPSSSPSAGATAPPGRPRRAPDSLAECF